MSRKDFELIAKVVSRYQRGIVGGEAHRASLARAFASELLNANHNFNVERFITACTTDPKEY